MTGDRSPPKILLIGSISLCTESQIVSLTVRSKVNVSNNLEKLYWVSSAAAVYQLAEFFGGSDVAKTILAAQLKIGKLRVRTKLLEIDQKIDFGSSVIKNGLPLPPKVEKMQQMERDGSIVSLYLGS